MPQGGGEGMLATLGGRFGGYGLYLLKGKPVFTYNLLALERFRWEGRQALTPGKHTIVFDFTYDGPGFGKGGTGVLKVDGKQVADEDDPAHHSVPGDDRRVLRCRRGYPHAGRRQGLPGAVPLHRQARQADDQAAAARGRTGSQPSGAKCERRDAIEGASTWRLDSSDRTKGWLTSMESSEDVIRCNVESLMKLIAALDAAGIELISPGCHQHRRWTRCTAEAPRPTE